MSAFSGIFAQYLIFGEILYHRYLLFFFGGVFLCKEIELCKWNVVQSKAGGYHCVPAREEKIQHWSVSLWFIALWFNSPYNLMGFFKNTPNHMVLWYHAIWCQQILCICNLCLECHKQFIGTRRQITRVMWSPAVGETCTERTFPALCPAFECALRQIDRQI